MGVDPDGAEGADVFREPDEEGDEREAEEERHAAVPLVTADVDGGARESDGNECEEEDADVWQEVVREKVCVDEGGDDGGENFAGVTGVARVHDAGGAGDEAADGGVHEPGEEGDLADAEEVCFGVGPGVGVGFEELHEGADDVEDEDDACFAEGFHAEDEERGLDGEGGEEEEVVAGERGVRGVEEFCEDDEREQERGEEAGPGLLEGEEKELPEEGGAGAGGDVGF